MAGYNYLTKEGYERLKAELDELKSTGRSEAAAAIAEAREKGDLSENAEYDAAKDRNRKPTSKAKKYPSPHPWVKVCWVKK